MYDLDSTQWLHHNLLVKWLIHGASWCGVLVAFEGGGGSLLGTVADWLRTFHICVHISVHLQGVCLFLSSVLNIRVWNQRHNTHHTYRFVQRQWDLSCFGPLLPYLTDKGNIMWYKFWLKFWFLSNVHLGKREHHLMIWWCAWFPCAVVDLLDMLLLSWESYAYFDQRKQKGLCVIYVQTKNDTQELAKFHRTFYKYCWNVSIISLVLGWSHIFCDMSQRYGVLFRDILHGFLYSVNADHTNMIYKNTPRTLTYWV